MNASSELAARDRRRNVRAIAPIVGLLAVGLLAWQSSYAAFSAQSDNGQEAWTTGNITLQNNGGTGNPGTFLASTTPVFTPANMKPGDTLTKCITVKSTDSYAGSLHFYVNGVTDTTPTTPKLGTQLQFQVDEAAVATPPAADCSTGFPGTSVNVVPAGTALTAIPTTYAGSGTGAVAQVANTPLQIAYKITYTFVSSASDNTLMGQTAKATFNWDLQ